MIDDTDFARTNTTAHPVKFRRARRTRTTRFAGYGDELPVFEGGNCERATRARQAWCTAEPSSLTPLKPTFRAQTSAGSRAGRSRTADFYRVKVALYP